MALNAVREALEAAVDARQSELERAELSEKLSTERVDVTLPAALLGDVRVRPRGSLHPTTHIRRDVEDAFIGLGYEIREDREIETVEYNFDKLAFPEWHPARSPRDTFYVDVDHLLRTDPRLLSGLEHQPHPPGQWLRAELLGSSEQDRDVRVVTAAVAHAGHR